MIFLGLSPVSRRSSRNRCCYRVAGCALVSDASIAELAGFRTPPSEEVCDRPSTVWDTLPGPLRLVYDGVGKLGGGERGVTCWSGPAGYRMSIAGIGAFSVARDGRAVFCERIDPEVCRRNLSEAVLGPALILALALRGVWCLHAAAVAAGNKLVAFAGESGTGKSTLAAFLGAAAGAWQHVADDVLPLISDGNRAPLALPRFPQLKLRTDEQPGTRCAEQMPLSALYVLETTLPGSGATDPSITPLEGRDRVLAFLSSTVAAHLFDRDLLRRHAETCARLAARVPVRRLRYARDRSALPRIREAIERDL